MSKSLSRTDLSILCYINKYGPVPMDLCLARFGEDSRPRIISLFNSKYIENVYPDGSSRSLGFSTTVAGRNVLQDSHWATYERVRDSILIPIAVSVLTTAILHWLQPML